MLRQVNHAKVQLRLVYFSIIVWRINAASGWRIYTRTRSRVGRGLHTTPPQPRCRW